MNYCSFPKGSTSYDSSYGGEYYENLYEYMYNNGMITVNDNYKSFNEDYLTSDITTEELDKRALVTLKSRLPVCSLFCK